MKLAFVVRHVGPGGGTEKYVADLVRWLAGRGHQVDLYCRRADLGIVRRGPRGEPYPAEFDAPGVRIVRAGLPGAFGLVAARVPGEYDVVQGFGRSLGHDVYRAGGGAHAAWVAARDTTLARRVRTTLSVREWVERGLDRRAVRKARVVVCNSQMAADDVARWYGVSGVRVVRNGVDLDRFRPDAANRLRMRVRWEVPEGGRVALFLGNGFRRKGLDVAASAFERVAGPRDRFVVAGRDAHADAYLEPVRRLGPRLVVVGATAEPEACLVAADATLLPTLYDAAANTTLEALACGVPPVTSRRDGNAEIVPDSACIVDDPRDVDGFAAALEHAWTSRDGRWRAAAEAWPVSRNGLAMERIYEECRRG